MYHLLKTSNTDWKQSSKANSHLWLWLVNNDLRGAACCPGQLASAGASDSIPYKTLLKMSVKCLSFFPHVIPSVLFNNGRVKPSVRDRDRHRDRRMHRDGQRMEEDTGNMKQRRPTWTHSWLNDSKRQRFYFFP